MFILLFFFGSIFAQTCTVTSPVPTPFELCPCPDTCLPECTSATIPLSYQSLSLPTTANYASSWQEFGRTALIISSGTIINNAGRAHSVVQDPVKSDTVYLSNIGGLWMTPNFSAVHPFWYPLTDNKLMENGLDLLRGGLISDGNLYTNANASLQPRSVYIYATSDFRGSNFGARGPRKGILRYDTRDGSFFPAGIEGLTLFPDSPHWNSTRQFTNLNTRPTFQENVILDILVIPTPGFPENDTVIVGTLWGIVRSEDSGLTWNYTNDGLDTSGIVNEGPSPVSGFMGDIDEVQLANSRVIPVPAVYSITRDWVSGKIWIAGCYQRFPFLPSGAFRSFRPPSEYPEWCSVFESTDNGKNWMQTRTSQGDNDVFWSDPKRGTVTIAISNGNRALQPFVIDPSTYANSSNPIRVGDMVMTRQNASSSPIFCGRVTGITDDFSRPGLKLVQVEQWAEEIRTGPVGGISILEYYHLSTLPISKIQYWQGRIFAISMGVLSSVRSTQFTNIPTEIQRLGTRFHGMGSVFVQTPGNNNIYILNVTSNNGWINSHILDEQQFAGGVTSAPSSLQYAAIGTLQYYAISMIIAPSVTNSSLYLFCVGGFRVLCTYALNNRLPVLSEGAEPYRELNGKVDQHDVRMVRYPNGTFVLVIPSDGGITTWDLNTLGFSPNNSILQVSEAKNLNFRMLEVYTVASSPARENVTRNYIACTQDNANLQLDPDTGVLTRFSFGDGLTTWISQTIPEQGIVSFGGIGNGARGLRNTTVTSPWYPLAPPVVNNHFFGSAIETPYFGTFTKMTYTPTPYQDPSGSTFYVWNEQAVYKIALNTTIGDDVRGNRNFIIAKRETITGGIYNTFQGQITGASTAYTPQWFFMTYRNVIGRHIFTAWRSPDSSKCTAGDPLEFVMDQSANVWARAPSCFRSSFTSPANLSNTWTYQGTIPRPTPQDSWWSLHISQQGILFAGNSNPFNTGTNMIAVSYDFGRTWISNTRSSGLCAQSTLLGCTINHLASDPWRPNTVYAATSQGVFWSQDNAITWKPFGTGLPLSCNIAHMYVYPSGASMLVGTMGRGVWQIALQGSSLPSFVSSNPNATEPGLPYPPGQLSAIPASVFVWLANHSAIGLF